MNFIKSEPPLCPNVLIHPVFQVVSDEGRVTGLLPIVSVCSALAKHAISLSHVTHSLHLLHPLQ
jgi:hypothetical protein